jgi:hypothetical protein
MEKYTFTVMVVIFDWGGLKKGDVYVCLDNEYYRLNQLYYVKFHKDMLKADNPNLDFNHFKMAENIVKEKLGVTGSLFNIFAKFGGSAYNESSVDSNLTQ